MMMRWICGVFKFTLYASLASRTVRSFIRFDGGLTVFRSEDQDFWNEEEGGQMREMVSKWLKSYLHLAVNEVLVRLSFI